MRRIFLHIVSEAMVHMDGAVDSAWNRHVSATCLHGTCSGSRCWPVSRLSRLEEIAILGLQTAYRNVVLTSLV